MSSFLFPSFFFSNLPLFLLSFLLFCFFHPNTLHPTADDHPNQPVTAVNRALQFLYSLSTSISTRTFKESARFADHGEEEGFGSPSDET
jgi:hypothetical protein